MANNGFCVKKPPKTTKKVKIACVPNGFLGLCGLRVKICGSSLGAGRGVCGLLRAFYIV
jgi:hypothetical protein